MVGNSRSLISLLLLAGPLLALSEDSTQLRRQPDDNAEEPHTFFQWVTDREAEPAQTPSAAEYIVAEAAAGASDLSCNASLLAEEPVTAPRYTSECYTFTGGTCLTTKCDASRGAVCESGKCICGSGCGGADGTCYKESNELIAEDFTLTNVKWPKYRMFFRRVTTFGQMDTSKAPSITFAGSDKFKLYKLPGALKNETTKEEASKFFLGSQGSDDKVLAIRPTAGTALSPWGTYAVKLKDQTAPWNPRSIMMTICSKKKGGYPNAIMIGSSGAKGNPIWAYVHKGSSFVYGSVLSPGPGGYWNVDPPLPEGSLPDCDA